jgi:hypothetical protein
VGTRRLLLNLAPSLAPLLCSLGQVLSRVESTLGDDEHQWLQQLERLLALLGGLAIAAQLRPDNDDVYGRHARWLDEREGAGSNDILATLPAPELLGALLPHVGIADDFRASALSPAATTVVAAGSPRTTATAIATPPRTSTRKTLLAPRSVIHSIKDRVSPTSIGP